MALHALPFAIDAEPGQARQAAGRRVLLVGLDASSRKDASRWLASAGFEVGAADDAASALPLLEGSRPDVVFADASLRAEGLRAVGQALRSEDGRAVPIVALCASRRDVGRVLDAGIADLVERPFDWRVVSLRVQSLLRLAEAECELRLAKRETDALRRTLDDEQREKEYRDTRDSLTGLPNGDHLERALESALVGASETSPVALAIFEVEQLVLINNRLGRARANSVLQQVAQRLSVGLRSEEVLHASVGPSMSMAARVGGGHFAAMLTGLPGWQEVKATVSQLVRPAVRPLLRGRRGDRPLHERGNRPRSRRRAHGGDHAPEGRARGQRGGGERRRRPLLRAVAARQRAQPHHHPPAVPGTGQGRDPAQLPAARGGTRPPRLRRGGAPALAVARARQRAPSEFVPLAEEAGLMMSIGGWGLRTATAQARAWREQGLPLRRVAVNVSLCQLVRGDLAQVVREVLQESEIDPSMLELELSERGVLRSDPEILRQLRAIRALGVRLAIDDFGTGNSAVASSSSSRSTS